ncbi:hypothetical protein EJ02DRAFT_346150 [Clathrospora elynae]|uniref:chitinase n=1 Tax=Clathrospora elynae TaxID=706981 RepID=A0A6A5SQZ0_9PLEO|nr:hypothetical protein EJ02DRAFT_346150 [Clathrospora elynae]
MRFQSLLLVVLGGFTTLNAAKPFSELDLLIPREPNLNYLPLLSRGLPTGTCNAQTPCENAACCGTNGLCGYSPTECGKGNCTSNCDAKAECGQYGVVGKQNCPLGVCCSEFGFCGSTDDFCLNECQSGFGGCGPPKRPSCGGAGIAKRTIGYYESWSATRKCQSVQPEDLNLNGYTHVNFAFAFFDPATFQIAPMDGNSGKLYSRFTGLKSTNRGLQTWISVGGWSFTDPGPTRSAFSDMSSNSGNRQKFIRGLISFMDNYGFDGVDLDWEYPQANDRGGVTADKDNYVALVKEMRQAFGSKYGISMTLPTSYWYLQHFDLKGIQDSVDWFNLMSYDSLGPYIAPHTNVTEIDLGLDLLWRAGVTPGKVVIGFGWYGRSFTLTDSSCNTPNRVCKFSGGADPGPCSDASGIFTYQEIQEIIFTNKLTPTWDKTAAVKWISWGNQWVSYDDEDTFKQKRDFANSRCLGGSMVWAIDQMDQKADNGLAPAPGVTTSQQQDASQKSADLQASITCYTTDCGAKCKRGTNGVAQMNGQPGQLSTNNRCEKNEYRDLCCDDGTIMGICQWRGYRGVGLSCISGCGDGETEVTTNTNNHDKHGDQSCTGGIQSYCCKGFKPLPSKGDLKKKAEDGAKAAAEAAAANAALDVAAKVFCRVAVPALLAPLEALEALIPIFGEIADLAEIAATPALIQLCVKLIEKEGKAEFKIFGKKHTLSMDKPTAKPSKTRPSESSHTKPQTSTDSCDIAARDLDGRAVAPKCKKPVTSYVVTDFSDKNFPVTKSMVCDFSVPGTNLLNQACMNYASVIDHNPGYDLITCPFSKLPASKLKRPIVDLYNRERNRSWVSKIVPPSQKKGCERDEWPPAALHEVNNGLTNVVPGARLVTRQQYVRLLDGVQNGNAGQLWKGCPKLAATYDQKGNTRVVKGKNIQTKIISVKRFFTRSVFSMGFDHKADPDGDNGLKDNPCQPLGQKDANGNAIDNRGFALLNEDSWFNLNPAAKALTDGWKGSPTWKRDEALLNLEELVVIEANSSRRLTNREIQEELGIHYCEQHDCKKEMEVLGIESALDISLSQAAPAMVSAVSTTLSTSGMEGVTSMMTSTPKHVVSSANIPRQTFISQT